MLWVREVWGRESCVQDCQLVHGSCGGYVEEAFFVPGFVVIVVCVYNDYLVEF